MSISAIKVSELEGHARLDAEYYQPRHLIAAKRFEQFKALADYKPLILHPTEVKRVYEEEGLQLLFTQNIRANYLDFSHIGYLPLTTEEQIRKNRLQSGDVVVTRTGANFGDASSYDGSPSPIYASAHCIIVRCKDIPGGYLSTYFNTDIGKALLKRGVYGAAQPEIAPDYIRTLHIPRFGEQIEKQIEQRLLQAKQKRETSQQLYAEAERLLSAELRLDQLDLPLEDVAIKRLSDISNSKRLDAEYFHPQKAFVQEWLDNFTGKPIGDYFKPVREIYNPPGLDTGKVILNFDLTDALNYFVDEDSEITPENEIGSIKKWLKGGDIIVSRLRSYLKEIAYVNIPQGVDAVGSSEFIVLRQFYTDVHPELLMVYLRSKPVQTVLKWSQDGSNHPRFQESELLAIRLPDEALKSQDEIRRMVQSGIQANKDAKRLLAEAKAEVERLVEGELD